MSSETLKLTVYFGESDRSGPDLLSDALLDLFEQAGVRAAALLRGIEGFGAKQQLRTQRLLTLSDDAPLVAFAVDERERIERLLPAVERLVGGGLLTLERAEPVGETASAARVGEAAKLTVHLGRAERAAGRPAFVAAVDLFHAHGLDGATVLLGLDGVVAGTRRRATFFSRNAAVPLLVTAIGPAAAAARAVDPLRDMLPDALLTVERVVVCKRSGDVAAPLPTLPDADGDGLGLWQQVTVHAPEDAAHGGHAVYLGLIRRLREEGAAGATALRGLWGFTAGGEPHGDRLLSLRRTVPVATVVIDRPSAMRRWWPIIAAATAEVGIVTSEIVPAARSIGPGFGSGGLGLARPHA